MNAKVKKLWVEALKSGEYFQGKGQLVIEPKDMGYALDIKEAEAETGDTLFCCLGVLTNIYVEETGDTDAWRGLPIIDLRPRRGDHALGRAAEIRPRRCLRLPG